MCWDFGRALHRRNRTHNSTYAVPGICDHSVFVGLPSTYMDALPFFLLPSSLYQTKCTITIVYHQHCSVTAETKAILFLPYPDKKSEKFCPVTRRCFATFWTMKCIAARSILLQIGHLCCFCEGIHSKYECPMQP